MMLLQKGASVNTKIRIRAEPPAETKPGHKPAWTFNPLGKRQQSNDREYPLFQVNNDRECQLVLVKRMIVPDVQTF